MPLYILHELHLPEKTAGVTLGTVTGFKIPYAAARLAKPVLWETVFDAPGSSSRDAVYLGC